jgi:hypothetical protein
MFRWVTKQDCLANGMKFDLSLYDRISLRLLGDFVVLILSNDSLIQASRSA